MWYYHLYAAESWDFLPGYDIVLQADSDSHHNKHDYVAPLVAMPASASREDGVNATQPHHWTANSQLQQVSPLGALTNQYIAACAGAPMNFNKITHECRVDASSPRPATPAPAARLLAAVRRVEVEQPPRSGLVRDGARRPSRGPIIKDLSRSYFAVGSMYTYADRMLGSIYA